MPRETQDAFLKRCRTMVRAVRRYEAELGGVKPFRDTLETAYTQTLFNRQRQLVARAAAKEATRQLRGSFSNLHDAAAALQYFLKSVLGFRSEKLRLFAIEPREKRSPSRKKPAPGFELPS